jgi:hypothetical protein
MSELRRTWSFCLLVLLLNTSCSAASGEDQAAARRIPALEEIRVTYCLGDKSLFWTTRSGSEHRSLFTPAFYEKCSSGTGVFRIWPCCPAGQSYTVIHSRGQLEKHFAEELQNPALARNRPASHEWIDVYLATIDQTIDFDREVLVLSSNAYGPTGNATASLDFERQERTLTATIRIQVPPPPLTPDTAFFTFAFAVSKREIDRVEIVTFHPAISDLGISRSSETVTSFSIKEESK